MKTDADHNNTQTEVGRRREAPAVERVEADRSSSVGGSPFRPWLDEIRPYVPGKPPEEVLEASAPIEPANLASNENPLGPPKQCLDQWHYLSQVVNRYPDDQAQMLKEALSERFDFPLDHLAVGNGSNDLIDLLVRITSTRGTSVVISDWSFPTCPISARGTGAEVRAVPQRNYTHDLAGMRNAIDETTRLVYICNPNNPTGTMNTAAEVDEFLDGLPSHVLVVFDEAYFEFVERKDFPDLLPRVLEGQNICVLRTFSKCYSLASLRVGYGFCPPQVTERIEKIRLPFNVNAFAQRMASVAILDRDSIAISRHYNRQWKAWYRNQFENLDIEYIDSETNFFMIHVPEPADLHERLLKRAIIIRPLTSFGLPRGYYRVSIGRNLANENFMRSLEEILGKDSPS